MMFVFLAPVYLLLKKIVLCLTCFEIGFLLLHFYGKSQYTATIYVTQRKNVLYTLEGLQQDTRVKGQLHSKLEWCSLLKGHTLHISIFPR